VGTKIITKQEREMVKLPNFQFGVIIGIILSDGYLGASNRSVNKRLFLKQSLKGSKYLLFVFNLLSHYCVSYPYIIYSTRAGVKSYGLEFNTRAYPIFTELHLLFYPKGIKLIPHNIYELLSPVALAHLIMGDGSSREYGLEICTDSYPLPDIIRLMNVLVIRYRLICTTRLKRENQYRIYISSKSMKKLILIVKPYMHETMMYKLNTTKGSSS